MRRALAVLVLLASPGAFAEPRDPLNDRTPFVSRGLVLGGGSRGFTVGIEVSGGVVGDLAGAYVGAAGGVDLAPWSGNLPRVRAYAEAEAGWVAIGVSAGPAWFFDGKPVALQLGAHASFSSGAVSCERHEPFDLVGGYYRFTSGRDYYEGGGYAKAMWFPNGDRDHGVCNDSND